MQVHSEQNQSRRRFHLVVCSQHELGVSSRTVLGLIPEVGSMGTLAGFPAESLATAACADLGGMKVINLRRFIKHS